MLNSPLVSIIIPTFNRANLIGETLDSVIGQTYTNWECIVIDDGSTDGTDKLLNIYLQKDTRIQYLQRPSERPKGANSCRNYGFEFSRGEYVNWFDSDDIMHPEKLEIQINQLENSRLNYSVCQSLVFENIIDNIIGLRSPKICSDNNFRDYLGREVVWLTDSPIWKRHFLSQFEYLFDEKLQAAQEYEFYCRVLYESPRYEITEKPLVYIKKHTDSISYNSIKKKRMFHYFLARYKILNNDKIILDNESTKVLKCFLITNFKGLVVERALNFGLVAFKLFVSKEKNFSIRTKVKLFLSIFSFYLFRKGEVLLKTESF